MPILYCIALLCGVESSAYREVERPRWQSGDVIVHVSEKSPYCQKRQVANGFAASQATASNIINHSFASLSLPIAVQSGVFILADIPAATSDSSGGWRNLTRIT